jgi:LEA14-like dessication related protein
MVVTDVRVDNPNGAVYNDLPSLTVDQRTRINDMVIVENTSTVASLPSGEGNVTTTVEKPHSTVPQWWASHVRNEERSQLNTRAFATVEVGGESDRTAFSFLGNNEVVETDLLAEEQRASEWP